jgi:ribosomal protein L14
MIYVETVMRIMDNSGGYFALCIRILTNSHLGRPGDEIVIAIKSIILNKKISRRKKRKVLKGTVRKAVLLRCAYNKRRWGNMWVKMSTNAVALIGR